MNSAQEGSSKKVDEPVMPGFSHRFRAFLVDAFPGRNYREVGDLLGVGKSTMTNYTKNDRVPKMSIMLRIRELTGVNLNWLITGEDPGELPYERLPECRAMERALERSALTEDEQRYIRPIFNLFVDFIQHHLNEIDLPSGKNEDKSPKIKKNIKSKKIPLKNVFTDEIKGQNRKRV